MDVMLVEVLVALLCVYWTLSLILLRWPTLLHKKKTTAISATVVCHRGGSGEFIENTLHAFSSSVKLGCDMLEIDCQLTKDEEVVVSHDNDLTRATGVSKCISDLAFNELPQYSDQLAVTFGFGRECKAEEGVSRQIPLLRTVFEQFPHTPINIDVKTDNPVLIKKISALTEEFNRVDITVWGSFSDAVNRKCQMENPRIATFVPIKQTLKIVFAYYLGLLPFLSLSDGFFEVPLVQNFGRMPNVVEYIKARAARIPAFLKCGFTDDDLLRWIIQLADFLLMSEKLVNHLRARGIQVFYWVCNTEKDYDKAFSMGRVAVVTDYPSQLMHYLGQHPEIQRGTFSSKALPSDT
ncbi:Glycerophosphodiester phosphodiesterase domain-containing protein [Echinococcus granulosus]|uniref:Glycerophosphodiester phosphodiesterase domain-containing protein n=1 Tax=Echinococcus granulosus TaxID=6210 RepID=W6UDT8_ECHGR|nr:Glycerophosphodiester phosphodiesterase domain-containing protein [Echinococcus granulosus]EUB59203.1 Glycerophosphodiester phosphodiesterase domain-containing protein [Echinococcus granulosus]